PELITANEVFVCEGEKDADNVRALGLGSRDSGVHVAATTNFDGAGKWVDEYAIFFAGKKIVVLPDNDDPGQRHAQDVAASLYPYALGVKVIRLPDLPDKGDVSDYLTTHTSEELLAEVKKAPQWQPSEKPNGLLVPVVSFLAQEPEKIEWFIESLIQK